MSRRNSVPRSWFAFELRGQKYLGTAMSMMSTALKREVYGRGRGDPVSMKSAVDDLGTLYFRNMALLRSADMGSLAFVFGYCRQAYPTSQIKSTRGAKLTNEIMSAKIISNLVNY